MTQARGARSQSGHTALHVQRRTMHEKDLVKGMINDEIYSKVLGIYKVVRIETVVAR